MGKPQEDDGGGGCTCSIEYGTVTSKYKIISNKSDKVEKRSEKIWLIESN